MKVILKCPYYYFTQIIKKNKKSLLEICLNARNPASVITVISPKNVLPQWGLPDVSYHFITQ